MADAVHRSPDASEYDVRITDEELYRDLICRIAGVLYCHCVLDEDAQVEEVHVISDTTRSPKQLVRDIQSAMIARFNLKIDHRIISIAQIEVTAAARSAPQPQDEQQEDTKPCAKRDLRLSCNEISYTTRRDEIIAEVVLSFEDKKCVGSSHVVSSAYGKMYVVAEATINAIHDYFKQTDVFRIQDVKAVQVANHNAVMVLLSMQGQPGNGLLLGSAVDYDDPQATIVKATLDALNRRIAILE